MVKCSIPKDCYGCFKYNDCRDLDEYRESKGPNPIFIATTCFALFMWILIIYGLVK